MRWCKQDNNQHLRGFTGTWTLSNGSTETHTWGQVRENEDDICSTHLFPDEIMFGQLWFDANDVEGMAFWDSKGVYYDMRADGTTGSPRF